MAGGSPGRLQRDLTTLFQTGTAAGLTDRELIARISRRSFEDAEASFEALVTRHGPMVLRVCRNVLNDPHDAEDAFQATFLVLVKQLRTIRNRDSIGSWLYGVAARVSARARVEAAKRRKHEQGTMRLAVVSAPDDDAHYGLAVQEEVLRLPDRYRSVVVLCYWEGLTHEQVAARLACPLGTVRSRIARARDLLRKRLVRRGVAPEFVETGPAPAFLPLSSALVYSTVKAASKVASGQVVSKVVAAQVAALTLQFARRMVMMKIGMVAAPTCLVLAASIGLGVGAQTAGRSDSEARPPSGNGVLVPERTPPRPPTQGYIVEPPDLLRVDVVEALPGRPLSGQVLVHPDGRLSLGYYGTLPVAGLTVPEIKEEIILHMRKYLTDEALGLRKEDPVTDEIKRVAPRDSDRVFVDVAAYNSKIYRVLGEVPRPGKFVLTGNETILDAVAFAGGLTSMSDLNRVFLVRDDAQGGKQKLPVHLDKITSGGDASTNYRLQAGDLLVVYRDPKFQDEDDRRPPAPSSEPKDKDDKESDVPETAPGLEGKVERLECRLGTVEMQLRKILERLDASR